jgi:hypothetical protein
MATPDPMHQMKEMISKMNEKMTEEFANIKKEFTNIDGRFAKMDERFDKIDERFDKIDERLEGLERGNVLPKGDAEAAKLTVAINVDGIATGHGLLVKIDTFYYVLSAAHVLIDLTMGENRVVKLEWVKNNNELEVKMKVTAIYITKEYVKGGTHDIGLAEVTFCAPAAVNGVDGVEVNLLHCDEIVGRRVVGHGQHFYAEGRCIYVSNSMRVMIQAPSVPGCSGCPLFDFDENLCLILHGDLKQRGREKQRGHSAAGGDFDTSSRVYADVLKGREFFKVPSDPRLCEALRKAEDVDLAWIEDSAKAHKWKASMAFSLFRDNGDSPWPTAFENYQKSIQLISVDDIMKELSGELWPEEGEPNKISFKEKEKITCMCPNKITGKPAAVPSNSLDESRQEQEEKA